MVVWIKLNKKAMYNNIDIQVRSSHCLTWSVHVYLARDKALAVCPANCYLATVLGH